MNFGVSVTGVAGGDVPGDVGGETVPAGGVVVEVGAGSESPATAVEVDTGASVVVVAATVVVVAAVVVGATVFVVDVVVVGPGAATLTVRSSPSVKMTSCLPSTGPGVFQDSPGASILAFVAPVGQAAKPLESVTTLMPSAVLSTKLIVSPVRGPLDPVSTTPVSPTPCSSVQGPAFAVDSTARS